MSVLTNIKTYGSKISGFLKKGSKKYKQYHKTIDRMADFFIEPSIENFNETLNQGVNDYGSQFSKFLKNT